MIVVADTGPLIGLAKIDRLDLLTVLATEIFIPPHVHRELLSKSEYETVEIERALGTLLHIRELPALRPATADAIARLDAGERQAVGLAAASAGKTLVLMDDRAGRRAAEQLGLATTGWSDCCSGLKKRDASEM